MEIIYVVATRHIFRHRLRPHLTQLLLYIRKDHLPGLSSSRVRCHVSVHVIIIRPCDDLRIASLNHVLLSLRFPEYNLASVTSTAYKTVDMSGACNNIWLRELNTLDSILHLSQCFRKCFHLVINLLQKCLVASHPFIQICKLVTCLLSIGFLL